MSQSNFEQPTRQAGIGILVNFLFVLQKVLRAFFPLLVVLWFKEERFLSLRWVLLAVLVLVLVLIVVAYLSYRNFFFHLDKDAKAFVIQQGIWVKNVTTIPLDKIQQVSLNQKFINKIIGVYAVDIDSAGSAEKEAVIHSVSHEVAVQLKVLLLQEAQQEKVVNRAVASDIKEPIDENIRISLRTLLKIGLTTSYLRTLGLLVAFVFTLYDQFFVPLFGEYSDEELEQLYESSSVQKMVYIYGVICIVLLVLLFNVVRTFLRYFNYEVQLKNQTFLISYGLLSTKNVILRPKRIQIVKLTQNFFQRKMDLLVVRISQVSGTEAHDKNAGLNVPGYSEQEKTQFLKHIHTKALGDPIGALRPNYRYFLFRTFVYGLIPVLCAALYLQSMYSATVIISAAVAYLGVVVGMQYRRYKVLKLIVYPDYIVIRSGFWDLTETWVEPSKIQLVRKSYFFWQKKADIGSLVLRTAGGSVRFETTFYSQLEGWVNYWLYKVEAESEDWM